MEDPALLLDKILAWARSDPRVDAVVQTGSRARGQRVDEFSDLDLELIGRWRDLAADDAWWRGFGDVLVVLALGDDPAEGQDWPTRLVVHAGGRKVDFTLAGPERVRQMLEDGLDEVWDRGYLVHHDPDGRLAGLPAPRIEPRAPVPPTAEELAATVSEFWFEVTQVPVYLCREDLWVAQLRLATARDLVLRVLEWEAQTDPAGSRFTWHLGHHLDEWVEAGRWPRVTAMFSGAGPLDTLCALRVAADLFTEVSGVVAARLDLPLDPTLPTRVGALLDAAEERLQS